MFINVLPENGEPVLALLTEHGVTEDFYMAGGTAAALQLGHRRSYDLDFFTPKEFGTTPLIQKLSSIGEFKLTGEAEGTVHGILKGVRVSFMFYRYPLLFPTSDFHGVRIADLRDIGLMKITAISSRGSKKDFVDLYVICQRVIPLELLLGLFEAKYSGTGYSLYHLLRSLAYFDDAEREPALETLGEGTTWSEVKAYFRKEQTRLFERYRPPAT